MEPLNFTSAIMLSQHLGSRDINSSKSDKWLQESMFNLFSLSHLYFSLIIERVISQSSYNLPFYHRLARTLSNQSKFNTRAFLEVFSGL
ncbi:hypothetical protein QL285_008055 [Trifolium repens]|nr:hypothetical protein QL285_008055 [Trifolium repens]